MSTLAGSKPARWRAGTTGSPASARHVRPRSSRRSPIPVSTSTRPAGVSISRQFSAWRRRPSPSISSATSLPHRMRGTGPNSAPASERNVPAWTSATRTPAPRSADQWAASLSATRPSARRVRAAPAPRSEVAVECRGRGLALALVLRAEPGAAVRPLDGGRDAEEADLANPHPLVERDRQARDVRELEREVALPARVHVAGGRVDQQAESAKRALSLEAADQVVRQLHPLDRLAEHELPRMEDERLVVRDGEELGQVRLGLADVDERVPVVAEDPEAPVQVEVDGARLEVDRIICLDPPGRSPGGLRFDLALRVERVHLALEGGEILEALVDAREADIGDVVQHAKLVHRQLADPCRLDLRGAARAERGLDLVDCPFSGALGDRPPGERLAEPGSELFAIKLLANPVALDHDEPGRLDPLVRREARPAGQAFAPPADRGRIVEVAGVHHPRVTGLALRAVHQPVSYTHL